VIRQDVVEDRPQSRRAPPRMTRGKGNAEHGVDRKRIILHRG
jgi:hypothetical protein